MTQESLTQSRIASKAHTSGDSKVRLTLQQDAQTARKRFEKDVVSGLSRKPKSLPCKYFYDARGSELFERICQTPEYYITRTETRLLSAIVAQVAVLAGPCVDVLEPGSGAGEKIRILLDALDRPRSFTLIDISEQALRSSAASLRADYPDLVVHPLVADFTQPFTIPAHFFQRSSSAPRVSDSSSDPLRTEQQGSRSPHKKLIFFPGSTLSNFDPEQARRFLSVLRALLMPDDLMFIGVDRIKDPEILHRAYNDAQGVTAAFNLNMLIRMKNELGARLSVKQFEHQAFYNEEKCRIEMHLESRLDQEIVVGGHCFELKRGERIHTESSYKYSPDGFARVAEAAGFDVVRRDSDEDELFGLYLCRAV